MKNETWKEQTKKKDYKYCRLGNKLHKHIVFELTPNDNLNIFFADRHEIRLHQIFLNNESKRFLKNWIDENIK